MSCSTARGEVLAAASIPASCADLSGNGRARDAHHEQFGDARTADKLR